MGYPKTASVVDETVEFYYDHDLVLYGFDWTDWEHGHHLVGEGPRTDVSDAPPEVVLGLLMVCIRGERFCDGTVLSAFENGLMPRLLDRLLSFGPGAGQ